MKVDLAGTVDKVAEFIGINLDDELREITNRNSSFAFMKAHEDRFDDSMLRAKGEEVLNLPPGSSSSKVRSGEVGTHRYELTPEIVAKLDELWEQEITGRLGFKTFEAFREELVKL